MLVILLPVFVISYTGAFLLALVSRRAADPWSWPSFGIGLVFWGLLIWGIVWAVLHVSVTITTR